MHLTPKQALVASAAVGLIGLLSSYLPFVHAHQQALIHAVTPVTIGAFLLANAGHALVDAIREHSAELSASRRRLAALSAPVSGTAVFDGQASPTGVVVPVTTGASPEQAPPPATTGTSAAPPPVA